MTTPLMGLQELIVGPGGDSPSQAWNKLIINLQKLDAHNHTEGNGSRLTTGSLNIDANLSFNANAATELARAIFINQTSADVTPYNLQVVNGNLVYRSPTTTIPLTVNGSSIASAAGNITGMTGNAAVSYGAGEYSFLQDINLYAPVITGGVRIGPDNVVSPSNFVTLKAYPTTGYILTLPEADPDTSKILMSSNASGDLVWVDGLKSNGVTAGQVLFAASNDSVSGVTLTANQVVLGTGATPVAGQLTNTYVSPTAAIDGTKISPNFGAQNVVTTGTLNAGTTTVSTLNATTANVSGVLTSSNNVVFNGTGANSVTVNPPATFGNNVTIAGVLTANGQMVLGDGAGDTITVNGRVASSVLPNTTGNHDLGSSSLRWKDIYISSVSATNGITAASASLTGAISAASGAFSGALSSNTLTATTATVTNNNVTTLVVSNNSTLGDSTSDLITATARFASDVVPNTNGTRSLGDVSNKWNAQLNTATINSATISSASLATTTFTGTLSGNIVSSSAIVTTGSSGNISGVSSASINYIRVGDFVHVSGRFTASSMSGNGQITIQKPITGGSGNIEGAAFVRDSANGNILGNAFEPTATSTTINLGITAISGPLPGGSIVGTFTVIYKVV